MKALLSIVLVAVFLLGCGGSDSIDRVVREESSNQFFPGGMTSLIALPATAPATEVASTALGEPLTNIVVVKIRPVSIAYGDQEKRYPGSTKYTAVLVKANSGKKIVLLQYRSNKEHSGWWSQIYDSE